MSKNRSRSIQGKIVEKKKTLSVLGISLIVVSSLFIVSAYVSLDGMVEVRFAYDFNVANDLKVVFLDEDTFEPTNLTITRQDALDGKVTVSPLIVSFDSDMAALNYTEMNKFLCETFRNKFQDRFNKLSQGMFVLNPEFIKVRGLNFMMKLPAGNRISYVLIMVSTSKSGYLGETLYFFGLLTDAQESFKTIGKDKIIITLNRLACDQTAYDSFYNYMTNNVTYPDIPEVYPYQIDFSIQRTYQSISDMLRGA